MRMQRHDSALPVVSMPCLVLEGTMCLLLLQVDKGCATLRTLLGGAALSNGAVPWDALFETVLGDRERVQDEARLPRTGMPLETERAFSSAFVEQYQHGVRGQCV